MTLPAPMAGRLAQSSVLMSYCVELKLPDATVRLTDGGFYGFDVDGVTRVFAAKDETYGVLGGVGPITDGVTGEFPTVDIVILYPNNAALAAWAAPEVQGSLVRLWVCTLDPVTGGVDGDPQRWFKGQLNVPSLSVDENLQALSISVNSILADAKQADEGVRMNDGFHQRAWPGEKGMEYSSSVEQPDYWGSDTPKAVIDRSAAQLRMLQGLGVNL
jgi:hypothetical protein